MTTGFASTSCSWDGTFMFSWRSEPPDSLGECSPAGTLLVLSFSRRVWFSSEMRIPCYTHSSTPPPSWSFVLRHSRRERVSSEWTALTITSCVLISSICLLKSSLRVKTLVITNRRTIRLRFLLQLTSFFLAHVESLLQDMQFCHTLFDVLLHCPVLYKSSIPTHSSDPSAHNSLLRNQSFRIDAFSLRLTETPPSSLDINTTRAAYDCQDHWEISCVSQLRWHIPSV